MKWYSGISYKHRSEFFGFLLFILALFVLLSLATRTDGDDRWLRASDDEIWIDSYYSRNLAGTLGALVALSLYETFGKTAWLLAIFIAGFGIHRFLLSQRKRPVWILAGLAIGVFIFGVIVDLPDAKIGRAWDNGMDTISGRIGRSVAVMVADLLGLAGGVLVLGSVLLIAIYWAVPWKPVRLPAWVNSKKRKKKPKEAAQPGLLDRARAQLKRWWAAFRSRFERRQTDVGISPEGEPEFIPVVGGLLPDQSDASAEYEEAFPVHVGGPDNDDYVEDVPPRPSRQTLRLVARASSPDGDYEFPPLDLLEPARAHMRRRPDTRGAEILLKALGTFDIGVDGEIQSFPGPVITRYEFRPAPGVKVNQIVGLADDLALALSASRVRVVAPVPGKAVVGIEIPNADPEIVSLARVLGDPAFADSNAALPLALGETIEGLPFVTDLAAMPHLLIAGATGSGKSVCINVIITSLLYRHHPRDVRLLFIDPKMLELSMYQGIPHLERPVVTNPRAAERLLTDAVREMDDRYRTLANAGVRNIADFNLKATPETRLPYIVIVVDELADLMLSPSAAKIEMMITRLAQMARAVGLHLILATQRPSVDVITGLIKANFSCRIAFQVASKVDSRTILDGNGAEKLLGKGDMLYLSPGRAEPIRVHGAFISGDESTRLVEFLRTLVIQPEAIQNFTETVDGGTDADDDFGDVLFHQAADVVIRHKQGSVSLLQRRLGIGYQRAARLIDKLEEAGVVGHYDGSKAREVLWTREDYEEKIAATPH